MEDRIYFLAILVSTFICSSYAGEVLGCGGYVRSDVEINYSQVGIKLFTNQGNLKYETECAPNNGYYFIPLYDKGQYVIKVSPPSGWSFKPDSVSLKVDGETDDCSLGKDINFHFQGFAVIGKVVSAGSDSGPKGVTVSLYKGKTVVQTTETVEDGSYVFTPLSSGQFTVIASHPSWTLLNDQVDVEVADENGDAGSSLVVSGYSLSGSVTTDAQGTPGVNFVMHTKDDDITSPECTQGSPEGYQNAVGLPILCYIASDKDGNFRFMSVVPGSYVLVPYFESDTTKYEVTPGSLEVTVGHDDLILQQPFKVEGFSVTGRVTKSAGGEAIVGAKVTLDKSVSAITDENGSYSFHNIRSGKHKIKVIADKYAFNDASVSISPRNPKLADITPSKFQACFSVSIEKTAIHTGPWTIEVRSDSGSTLTSTTDSESIACILLTPGSYSASIKLSSDADEAGMRFGPLEHVFKVEADAVDELAFSQFLGEIHGMIYCIGECPNMTVVLRSAKGVTGAPQSVVAVDGKFSFSEVVPGSYQLTVQKEEWCWEMKTIPVVVNTQNVEVSLKQVGYQLTLASSHETTLKYTTSEGVTGTVVAQKGNTLLCVSSPGIYTFTPVGCHKFASSKIQWNTQLPSLITLSATKHQLTGVIRSTEVAPFIVKVTSGSQVTELGPLNPSSEDPNLYVFEHWLSDGENVVLTPGTPNNLYQYDPSSYSIHMPSDCVTDAVTFIAERALFIHGQVVPALAGVTINVAGGEEVYTYTTDSEGKYTAGPLDNSVQYSVTAEKKGYVMNAMKGKGHFEAYKLAEVIVEVKDENGEPLSGVLVSMSGGKSYRQNSLTEDDGTIGFLSLTPGDYFLRPMMKEYTFEPTSKMVTVDEGATIVVGISGSRVAYSVYGQTVSLSGEAETDVVVEAVGKEGDCTQYQEEAVSDSQGYFRIRGLLPKCQYDLRLKEGSGINQHVQRTLPPKRTVHTDNADVKDLKLIVLRPFNQMDVAIKVDTDPQYLSSLVARLYREDLPDSPIHSIKLGLHPYFMLPPMTADRRTYFLRLDSTLPSSQYEYISPEISFVADSAFEHLDLSFKPVLRSVDAEMSQGTVVGFALAIVLVVMAFNYDKMGPSVEKLSALLINFSARKPVPKVVSHPDVHSSEAVLRKKIKSRKI